MGFLDLYLHWPTVLFKISISFRSCDFFLILWADAIRLFVHPMPTPSPFSKMEGQLPGKPKRMMQNGARWVHSLTSQARPFISFIFWPLGGNHTIAQFSMLIITSGRRVSKRTEQRTSIENKTKIFNASYNSIYIYYITQIYSSV
jgi:hypothetical protein